MPMQTSQFKNLYLKKIDRAFFEAYDEEPEQWPKYLNNKTSADHAEITQRFAGTSNWEKKEELKNAGEQQFKLGDLIITEHTPYAVRIEMSREQYDDARYKEVENMTRDAGHGARNTVETNCAKVLDLAFDKNKGKIYDGEALCSDKHPNRGEKGGTQSNLASGPLTDANLKAGIILFRKQKDEAGKQIMQRPHRLIVNQVQQFTAATILQSALLAGSDLNDKNVLPKLELVDLLFTTNETAWFLQAKRHQMQHFFRVPVEFKRRPNLSDNGAWVWDGYFRDSTAIEDWRGFVGSPGV